MVLGCDLFPANGCSEDEEDEGSHPREDRHPSWRGEHDPIVSPFREGKEGPSFRFDSGSRGEASADPSFADTTTPFAPPGPRAQSSFGSLLLSLGSQVLLPGFKVMAHERQLWILGKGYMPANEVLHHIVPD